MKRSRFIPVLLLASVLLAGCSEEERREIRAQELKKAAIEAEQHRVLEEFRIKAEQSIREFQISAEELTARERNDHIAAFAKVAAALAAIAGLICFVVACIKRLAIRHVEERTKRHAMNIKAIEADPHLRPEHRKELYRAAIEAANRGGTPLIGYAGNGGGA